MELKNRSQVGQLVADGRGRLVFVVPGETLNVTPEAAAALLARCPDDWVPCEPALQSAFIPPGR